jgi:hypothetical protein
MKKEIKPSSARNWTSPKRERERERERKEVELVEG